jgi:hypothetical protein
MGRGRDLVRMPARSRVGRTSTFADGLVLARLIHCFGRT